MHNHDEKGRRWMKWGMMLCCIVPILAIGLWGFGGRALGASSWITWGGIGLMVGLHMFMMKGTHRHSGDDHDMKNGGDNSIEKKSDKKPGSGGGGCH